MAHLRVSHDTCDRSATRDRRFHVVISALVARAPREARVDARERHEPSASVAREHRHVALVLRVEPGRPGPREVDVERDTTATSSPSRARPSASEPTPHEPSSAGSRVTPPTPPELSRAGSRAPRAPPLELPRAGSRAPRRAGSLGSSRGPAHVLHVPPHRELARSGSRAPRPAIGLVSSRGPAHVLHVPPQPTRAGSRAPRGADGGIWPHVRWRTCSTWWAGV